MTSYHLDLLESAAKLLTQCWNDEEIKLLLYPLLAILERKPGWRSRYSRTISAISADLGITNEKPTSGPTQDTMPGKTGADSASGEKSSK